MEVNGQLQLREETIFPREEIKTEATTETP